MSGDQARPAQDPATPWRAIPRRTLLADDTYQIIRDALVTNQIVPGRRLNIEQLSKDLQVSITPIRHALVRLEADGLVTREPFKGYIASPLLDKDTVAEIFAARRVIEAQTAAAAARHAAESEVSELRSLADADPLAAFAGDEDEGVTVTCDEMLHRTIAVIGGNKVLAEVVANLNQRLHAYRAFHLQWRRTDQWNPDEKSGPTKLEHLAIVAAINDHDPTAAAAAMETHLTNASQRDIDSVPEAPIEAPVTP